MDDEAISINCDLKKIYLEEKDATCWRKELNY